jgi:hypothetical protein
MIHLKKALVVTAALALTLVTASGSAFAQAKTDSAPTAPQSVISTEGAQNFSMSFVSNMKASWYMTAGAGREASVTVSQNTNSVVSDVTYQLVTSSGAVASSTRLIGDGTQYGNFYNLTPGVHYYLKAINNNSSAYKVTNSGTLYW